MLLIRHDGWAKSGWWKYKYLDELPIYNNSNNDNSNNNNNSNENDSNNPNESNNDIENKDNDNNNNNNINNNNNNNSNNNNNDDDDDDDDIMSNDKYKNYGKRILWQIPENENEAFAGMLWFVKCPPLDYLQKQVDKKLHINIDSLSNELKTGLTMLQISHRIYLQRYYDNHNWENEIKWEKRYMKLHNNESWIRHSELDQEKKKLDKEIKKINNKPKENRTEEENKKKDEYKNKVKDISKELKIKATEIKQKQMLLFDENCNKRLYFVQETYELWHSFKSAYNLQQVNNNLNDEFVPKPLNLETCNNYLEAMEDYYDEKFKLIKKQKKNDKICNFLNESFREKKNDNNDNNKEQRNIRYWFNQIRNNTELFATISEKMEKEKTMATNKTETNMKQNGLIAENINDIWNTTGQDFEKVDWNDDDDFVNSDDENYEHNIKKLVIKQKKRDEFYRKKYQNLAEDTTKLFYLQKAPDHWKEMFKLDALGQPAKNLTGNARSRKNSSAHAKNQQ